MVGRSPCALNRISRIAPLGLRTCSTTAPGYIGIVLYKSGGSALLGSSGARIVLCTTGGALGSTGCVLQPASVASRHATSVPRASVGMNRSGRFTVLLIARRGFSQALIGQKNNDRIAVTIWQVLDRLGQPISQGSRGDPCTQGLGRLRCRRGDFDVASGNCREGHWRDGLSR